MILQALVDPNLTKEIGTSGIVTSDASTVTEEAISKGTAKVDPEGMIGQETDIGIAEEGDQEVQETDHHADPLEMTQDLITEAESTGIIAAETREDTTGTIDALIVTIETEEIEAVIEDGIILVTRKTEATTDLAQERLQETTEGIDLSINLTDPTTREIDPTKKAATLLFTTRNCRITTSNPKTEKHRLSKRILSKTEK